MFSELENDSDFMLISERWAGLSEELGRPSFGWHNNKGCEPKPTALLIMNDLCRSLSVYWSFSHGGTNTTRFSVVDGVEQANGTWPGSGKPSLSASCPGM